MKMYEEFKPENNDIRNASKEDTIKQLLYWTLVEYDPEKTKYRESVIKFCRIALNLDK